MTKEELIGICSALVAIAERECCDYGFTKDIDRAEEYLNENEVESSYKEKWERLNYLLRKSDNLMKEKYKKMLEDGEKGSETARLFQQLQMLQNISHLVYQLDYTSDVSKVDVVIGGDK